jgi:hypothetical protein
MNFLLSVTDPRLNLAPQVQLFISNLTTFLNETSNSTANPCCLLPIQNDIKWMLNVSKTLDESLFRQTYPIDLEFVEGIQANIFNLYSNWTDCLTVGNCCVVVNETTTTTTGEIFFSFFFYL